MTSAIRVKDSVVFQTHTGLLGRMTLGTVERVLPDSIEVSYRSPRSRLPEFVFCAPEDCIRV